MITVFTSLLSIPGAVSASDSCPALTQAQSNEDELNSWRQPRDFVSTSSAQQACECGAQRPELIRLAKANTEKKMALHRIQGIRLLFCARLEHMEKAIRDLTPFENICADKVNPWTFQSIDYFAKLAVSESATNAATTFFSEIRLWADLDWKDDARALFDSFSDLKDQKFDDNLSKHSRGSQQQLAIDCHISDFPQSYCHAVNKDVEQVAEYSCPKQKRATEQCQLDVTTDDANLDFLRDECPLEVDCQSLYLKLERDQAKFAFQMEETQSAIASCGAGFWGTRFDELRREITDRHEALAAEQRTQRCDALLSSALSESSADMVSAIEVQASNEPCPINHMQAIAERLAELTQPVEDTVEVAQPVEDKSFTAWVSRKINQGKEAVSSTVNGIAGGAAESFYVANRLQINLAALKPKDMVYDLEHRRDAAMYFLKFLREVELASDNDIDVQIAMLEISQSEAMIDLIDEVKDDEIAYRNRNAAGKYYKYQEWKAKKHISDTVSSVSNYVSTKASRAGRAVTSSAKAAKRAASDRIHASLKAFAQSIDDVADSIPLEEVVEEEEQ